MYESTSAVSQLTPVTDLLSGSSKIGVQRTGNYYVEFNLATSSAPFTVLLFEVVVEGASTVNLALKFADDSQLEQKVRLRITAKSYVCVKR